MVRTTKVLLTVVTVAALALSMLAQALTAFADTDNQAPWHAHYFTENVEFRDAARGDSFQFIVGFTNGGRNSWVRGAANQEARLGTGWSFGDTANPNGNTNDFDAGWASNWLSSTRIAAQDDAIVLTARQGFFTYTAKVPANAPSGLKQIKGQPVIDGVTWLENYGYYQGFNVAAGPTPPPTGAISVTPTAKATNTVSTGSAPNENRGARTYTVTLGSSVTAPVRIMLFAAENVAANADGTFTFVDGTGDRKADQGPIGAAVIETVNGVSISPSSNVEASPPTGSTTLTFTIDFPPTTATNEQIFPVVWKDTNGDTQLDLDTPPCCGAADTNLTARATTGEGKPTETIGVGGQKDWTPEAATLGTYSCGAEASTDEGRVRFVDATAGYVSATFAGTERRFNFDDNDRYFYVSTTHGADGPGVTVAQFRSFVSTRDRLTINYNPDTAASSGFTLCADRPVRPSSASATIVDAPSATGAIKKEQRENCLTDCTSGTAASATAQTSTAAGDTQDVDTDVDDVQITFPLSASPCVKSYFVARQTSTDNAISWSQTQVVTANARQIASTDTTITVYDTDVPAGLHRWRVISKTDDVDVTAANQPECGDIDPTATGDDTGTTAAGSAARTSNSLTTTQPGGGGPIPGQRPR